MDYTNHQLTRIRHVNEMKRLVAMDKQNRKLMYCAGANLVLIYREEGRWLIEDQTGQWFDVQTEYWEEVEQ